MGTLQFYHRRLTTSKKKDSCDLCGENKWFEWNVDTMMCLCKECKLSNNFDKGWLAVWKSEDDDD